MAHLSARALSCFDCVVCLSIEPGAIRPVPAHQHVLMQHCRQTVSYTVVHELWSVRRQHRPLTQRKVRGHSVHTSAGRIIFLFIVLNSRWWFFAFCFSSTTLKLDGVKRVWGREGYLAQREAVEEAAQVEVPSPLRSPSQQAEADSSHSQTPTPTPTPEPDQEKQQLASSLFFGLSSQSSVCLVSLLVLLNGSLLSV